MALNKYKLKDLIEVSQETNDKLRYSLSDVKGISIKKIFIETKADMKDVSLKPYLLVKPDYFAYVTVTSRNGEKITLAHNDTTETFIVSSSYIVFKIKDSNIINSDYLYMYFNRPEFDRFSRYNSWGSARETFSWDDLCDIDIVLPDLPTQNKFVEVYKSMLENQKIYEDGLADLKIACQGYIENLRKNIPSTPISDYVALVNEKNIDSYISNIKGVEATSTFVETKANLDGVDLSNYSLVKKNYFAYNPSRINIGSIALYKEENPCAISPMYIVFKVNDEKILMSEYLMLWLSRSEFFRSTKFYAIGSVRDTFDFNAMKEVQIPIPGINIQKDIVDIYNSYINRREINEQLKQQIKDICPILIKGSIEEAKEA